MSRQTLNWLLGSVCAHCECCHELVLPFTLFHLSAACEILMYSERAFGVLKAPCLSCSHDILMLVWLCTVQYCRIYLLCVNEFISFCDSFMYVYFSYHVFIFFVHSNFAPCSNIASQRPEMLFHCVYSTAARFSEKKVDFTYNKYILMRTLEMMWHISLKTAYDRQKVRLLQNTTEKVKIIHHCKFTILQFCVTIQTWYCLVDPRQCTL